MSKDDNGDNILGTAILPNHSVFTFALVCYAKPTELQDPQAELFLGECDTKPEKLRPRSRPGDDSGRSAPTR